MHASRVTGIVATDAALKLAIGRFGVVSDGKRDAIWRVRDDGVVELVRAHAGRIELLEISADGTDRIVACSSRSTRKTIASSVAAVSAGTFIIGFAGFMVLSTDFAPFLVLGFLLLLVARFIRWKSGVRPWVRDRFETDDGWAAVPYRIDGCPTTGNQVVALSALARGKNDTYFRVLDGGDIEVAIGRRSGQLLRVDPSGTVIANQDRPNGVKVKDLTGPGAGWNRVYSYDPDE